MLLFNYWHCHFWHIVIEIRKNKSLEIKIFIPSVLTFPLSRYEKKSFTYLIIGFWWECHLFEENFVYCLTQYSATSFPLLQHHGHQCDFSCKKILRVISAIQILNCPSFHFLLQKWLSTFFSMCAVYFFFQCPNSIYISASYRAKIWLLLF